MNHISLSTPSGFSRLKYFLGSRGWSLFFGLIFLLAKVPLASAEKPKIPCLESARGEARRAAKAETHFCSKFTAETPVLVGGKDQGLSETQSFQVDVICANRISAKYEIKLSKRCRLLQIKRLSLYNPWEQKDSKN